MTDATDLWVRNVSDERAVAAGCRFDVERAAYAVWWIERHCRLYEGEQQGEPLTLCGCHQCGGYGLPASDSFATWDETRTSALDRAARYAACVAAGHHCDWQYECVMRLHGWVKHSPKWRRFVRRFRQASIWVPKKNKKSPTLAALGLYLLCGDGEPGQKVFFGAKDGKQARDIAGKHAVEMIEASAELTAECTINRNLMRITHEPSRSMLEPLSSGNSRHQQSKEGLNGCVLIDETHVVDREFIGRISRAGISRSEPLHIEVSTAGKERFDHACAVISGDVEDEQLFAAIYAAPQDVSDTDLIADPLKWGRLANPAMGHTVDPEEFLADFHGSRKKSLAEFGRCKMYRLNIWQSSSTPWLPMERWAANRRSYTEVDLLGRPCASGLDLAKSRDTCALVHVFPWDDGTFRVWARYWIPKARAELIRDKVDYFPWAASGAVCIVDGDVVDYALIRAAIIEDRSRFEVRKLAFDNAYAAQLMQRLIEEDGVFALDDVAAFGQTALNFAGPTDEFEADVIAGKLIHPGNPCLDFQARNAKVKTDANANKRPVKPPFGDYRTIDGVVAAIMGRAEAGKLQLNVVPSVTWF